MPKSFVNFDLELSGYARNADASVEFRVRAAQTPRGQVQALDAADRVTVAHGEIATVVANLADRWDVSEATFALACRALESWLLPPKSTARSLLDASVAALLADQCLLLRLRCTSSELAQLPWEFATYDTTGLEFDKLFHVDRTLAMHPGICLVRFDEFTAPVQRTFESATPRLMFVRSSPAGLPPLSLTQERERIEKEFADAQLATDPTWIEHVSGETLQLALDDKLFSVFQYSGHGESNEQGGFLCFERGDSGELVNFSAGNLGLALAGKGVSVAIMAACVTAEIEARLPWSSVARSLEIAGVPAVVGMQLNIPDQSALEFLARFHARMARFVSVAESVNDARRWIASANNRARDFGVPVLYLRNAGDWDGVAFRPPPQDSEFERRVRAADAYKRLHDALHQAKINAYLLLLGFANAFPPAKAGPLNSYVNSMGRCAVEMRAIAVETRNGRPLVDRDLVDPMVGRLERASAQLASSVEDKDREAFVEALLQLEQVFRLDMAMLDVLLHQTAKALDATVRQQLAQMIDDIKRRVVTHHAYQLLENMLDELRDKAEMDVVNVSRLKRRLEELRALLEACLPSMDAKTASLLQQRLALLKSDDVEVLTETYELFCSEVGMSFYKIDSDLRGVSSSLCADPRLSLQ